MRWFASLFVLALTMALFHRLTEAGPLEARAALALGFLLLAALLAGDLSRRWRLPRLTWFPLTVHQSFGDGVAVALVLGTLAAAASPAVTVALIGEMGARGPFTRAVLGVTIVQDVAVVLLLALVLALGKAVAGPGALNL